MKNTNAINKRMFVVKYLSATNTRGTRIRITDTRHRGKSIIKSVRLAINKIDNSSVEIFPKDTASNPEITLRNAKSV